MNIYEMRYLYRVTIFLKKSSGSKYQMSWLAIADTSIDAIEQVINDLDLTGDEVEMVKTKIENKPVKIDIKEFYS